MDSKLDDFLAQFGSKEIKHADGANSTAVIVALPSEVDAVRLVGPENKHATLLYFGETVTLPEDAKEKIIQVLTLAADMFEPFRESIIDISRLGSEVPPALVGKLNGRWLSKIHQILQVVPDLNEYMGNAAQYPSYTPHVTFGYPDWAGEAEIRKLAAGLGSISFDRLALWWNDEKYEFPLKYTGDISVEHKDRLETFLEHTGIKGMKWGVRKSNSAGGGTYVRDPQLDSISGSGSRFSAGLPTRQGDHTKSRLKGGGLNLAGWYATALISPMAYRYSDVHPVIKAKTRDLNKEYSQPGKNLATNKKLQADYDKKYQKIVTDAFKNTKVVDFPLPSLSKKIAYNRVGDMKDLKFDFYMEPRKNRSDQAFLKISNPKNGRSEDFRVGYFKDSRSLIKGNVKHADGSNEDLSATFEVTLTRDENGYITDMSIPDFENVKHTDVVDDFLEHTGIKGMKWGVRKNTSISSQQKKISLAYLKTQTSFLSSLSDKDEADRAVLKAATRAQEEIKNNSVSSPKLRKLLSKVSITDGESVEGAADGSRKALAENHQIFFPTKNGGEFYDSLMADYGEVKPFDQLDNFLAHFGVKGMRWGVRKDTSTGGSTGSLSKRQAKKALKQAEESKKNAPAGTLGTAKNASGKTIIVQKQKDGTWKETYFSADEQAYQRASAKPLHELSTREIQMIADRRRQINEYQRLLSPQQQTTQNQKSDLQLKVERLQLEKQYKDLQASLNPPKKSAVKSFIEKADAGFSTYKKIDKGLNGKLSKAIEKRLGLTPPKSELNRLKEQTDLLNARRNNKKAIVDLRKLEAQSYDWLIDDSPSRAVDYSGAGKRRANQSGGKRSEDRLWDIPNLNDVSSGKKK